MTDTDTSHTPRHDTYRASIRLAFPDGSEYALSDTHVQAVQRKYGSDRVDEWQHAAVAETCEHYENRTEPTRFGEAVPWGQSGHDLTRSEYPNMAALAPVVIYPDLRAVLMQVALERIAARDPEAEPPEVRALGPNGEERTYTTPTRDPHGGADHD